MEWKNPTTPPPHLTTVLGWYPEYEEDDERHYQLVYFSAIHKVWYALPDCEECAEPEQWAAIITPQLEQDEPLKAAS